MDRTDVDVWHVDWHIETYRGWDIILTVAGRLAAVERSAPREHLVWWPGTITRAGVYLAIDYTLQLRGEGGA